MTSDKPIRSNFPKSRISTYIKEISQQTLYQQQFLFCFFPLFLMLPVMLHIPYPIPNMSYDQNKISSEIFSLKTPHSFTFNTMHYNDTNHDFLQADTLHFTELHRVTYHKQSVPVKKFEEGTCRIVNTSLSQNSKQNNCFTWHITHSYPYKHHCLGVTFVSGKETLAYFSAFFQNFAPILTSANSIYFSQRANILLISQ